MDQGCNVALQCDEFVLRLREHPGVNCTLSESRYAALLAVWIHELLIRTIFALSRRFSAPK